LKGLVRLKNGKKAKKRKMTDVIGQKWLDKSRILIFLRVSAKAEFFWLQKVN